MHATMPPIVIAPNAACVDAEAREGEQEAEEQEQREEDIDRGTARADEGARGPHVERDRLAGEHTFVIEPGSPAPNGGRVGHG